MGNSDRLVDAVLFDYGGVIAEEGFVLGLKAIARANGLDEDVFFDLGADRVFTTGYLTGNADEGVFWKAMREAAGIQGTDEELTGEILSRFTLRPWVLQLADDLRAMGLVVGILSDQVDWLERLNERDGFFHHFSPVFNSYYLGLSKRGEKVFDEVARRLEMNPARVLFIDDNEGNCERARNRRLHAIHYRTGEQMLRELVHYVPDLDPSSYRTDRP